jgi:hypothetical protein
MGVSGCRAASAYLHQPLVVSEQVFPLVHWSSEPQGMVQRFAGATILIALQRPPEPAPHSVSSEHVLEAARSSSASQVVAVWLMPQ